MRNNLKDIDTVRATFTGIFSRHGTKSGYKGPLPTVLLQTIRDHTGKTVCDHLWFNLTKGFSNLGELLPGSVLQFDARVKIYSKGYVNHREFIDERTVDYKLSHPSKIKIVPNDTTEI